MDDYESSNKNLEPENPDKENIIEGEDSSAEIQNSDEPCVENPCNVEENTGGNFCVEDISTEDEQMSDDDLREKIEPETGVDEGEKFSQEGTDEKRLKNKIEIGILAGFILLLVCMGALLWSAKVFPVKNPDAQVNNGEVVDKPDLPNNNIGLTYPTDSYEKTAEMIYTENVNAVVEITCQVSVDYGFFGTVNGEAGGTGFVVNENGYIVTNNHVVENATNIMVSFYDGQKYSAEVVGVSEAHDIAVLKVEATGLNTVTIGSSSSLEVGNTIYTIGHPLGLSYSLSTGIISATERMINEESGNAISVIQLDCGINEGNSGGPLFNSRGEVIGVTNAKYAGSTIESIGFAIPIDFAMNDYYQIVEYGAVTNKASLGITYVMVDSETAELFHFVTGAFVHAVNEGSCAEKGGLKVGDIITKINNTVLNDSNTINGIMANFLPGQEMALTVNRNGEVLTIKVTLDAKED